MREDGMQSDGVTFLSVLTVCCHDGLVTKGQDYFEAMTRHYAITPTEDHYTCMVDLLGRAGHVDKALALIRTMPVSPNAAIWHTLLGACQKWSNVEVACHAFREAVKLDDMDAAAYVLMLNIYTGAQMWEQAQEMETKRTAIRAWKQPGQSWWTDTDGLVHTFSVGDKQHPKSDTMLEQLLPQIKKGECLSHSGCHLMMKTSERRAIAHSVKHMLQRTGRTITMADFLKPLQAADHSGEIFALISSCVELTNDRRPDTNA